MSLRRIAVTRQSIVVEMGGRTVTVPLFEASRERAEAELSAEMAVKLGVSPERGVWVHKNRDGGVAVATGTLPTVWPEDEGRRG